MDADHLKRRTKAFSLRILKLVGALPNDVQGRAIGSQLERDQEPNLLPKSEVVEEEADESAFWMELIVESEILREKKVTALHLEAKELVAIMARSRITAAKHVKRKP